MSFLFGELKNVKNELLAKKPFNLKNQNTMKKTSILLTFLLVALLSNFAKAQAPDLMVKEWERAKAYTKEYLDAMPEDGYGFKPTPDMRSFAEQMLHLTDANFGLGALASGTKSPIERGAAEKSADKSKEATTKMVMDGYDAVINDIKGLKPEQFQENVKFMAYEMSRAAMFNKIFEHQTHHRGQTTVYLRMKGVKAPQEKLF
jgi:uncharacterized damage-inducible protein DinB